MRLNLVFGRLKGRLPHPAFFVFVASTTLLSGVFALAASYTGSLWYAALSFVAPALVAVVTSESQRRKDLIGSLFNAKVQGKWIAISAATFPAIVLFALAVYSVTGSTALTFGTPRYAILFAALPLALCTELGWRGLAPGYLPDRYGTFVKSLVVGALWTVSLSPLYFLDLGRLTNIPLYGLALAFIPLSTLLFWLLANTRSLLMPAIFSTTGVMTMALVPILPADSIRGTTFWLMVGLLWLAAVIVAGTYGMDGLDRSIHELPPDELPVDWAKIMPSANGERKSSLDSRNGRSMQNRKSFTAVGSKKPRK